jgi:hypothetical protein
MGNGVLPQLYINIAPPPPRNNPILSSRVPILVDKMTKIFRIVGITGSLRKESWNTKLLNAFATAAHDPEFAERGVQFEIADWSKYHACPDKG